jgi:hypothetical protein
MIKRGKTGTGGPTGRIVNIGGGTIETTGASPTGCSLRASGLAAATRLVAPLTLTADLKMHSSQRNISGDGTAVTTTSPDDVLLAAPVPSALLLNRSAAAGTVDRRATSISLPQ